jgi:thiol-disulfide isomerase/thioredoxin
VKGITPQVQFIHTYLEDTMQTRKTIPLLLLIVVLILAACSTSKPPDAMMEKAPTATEVMMEKDDAMKSTATPEAMMDKTPVATDAMMGKDDTMESTATPEAMMEKDPMATEPMVDKTPVATDAMMEDKKDDAMMDVPAWFGVTLTNVQTGETFTIHDLKGKVVLVENMAQWCPTCKKQQQQVVELVKQLGDNTDVVILGLDNDPNEDAMSLKSYIESNGFIGWYAVAPAEVTHEISQALGDQFINPPSAPMFIIDRKGEIHPLDFGIKSADDLMKALQPFLDDDM